MEGLLGEDQRVALRPDPVSPAVLAMVSEAAPTRAIICAGLE
jgi:hypothetical protein